MVVMDGGLAGDVRVIAGWKVNPLNEAKSSEQLERSEDRRTAYRGATSTRCRQHVLRREVPSSSRDHVGDGAARAGQP